MTLLNRNKRFKFITVNMTRKCPICLHLIKFFKDEKNCICVRFVNLESKLDEI